jgi:hypothetical protein
LKGKTRIKAETTKVHGRKAGGWGTHLTIDAEQHQRQASSAPATNQGLRQRDEHLVGYAHRRSHSQPQLTAGEQQRGQVAGADEQLERSQQES